MMTPSNSVLSSAIDLLNPLLPRAIAARSVLFVDGGVGDYQQIVASAEAGTEVHLLDGRRDAIGQITDVLRGRSGIAALHILSHGADGELGFASGAIGFGNLSSYTSQLKVARIMENRWYRSWNCPRQES
jgi:Domain of unknown function (DUF4347)